MSEDGIGKSGGDVKKGMGGSQGGVNFLHSGLTGGTNFWLGDLGTFVRDGEEGGGNTHNFFLRQITGNRARRKADGRWDTPMTEVVQEAAVNQLEMT